MSNTTEYRSMHPQFQKTFEYYSVPQEMREAFWNYLAYGLDPGSFGLALFENNMYRAITSAHHMLTTEHIRSMVTWILNFAPSQSYGNKVAVEQWKLNTNEARRDAMIEWMPFEKVL